MKKYLIMLVCTLFSVAAYAADDNSVCAQLINKTSQELNIMVDGNNHSLANDESSKIFSATSPIKFQLLDGEITVYNGGAQITEDGNFNMQSENADIPSDQTCDVFYKLSIYK